jgi:DNA helicase-2/ATP-dependent DNA helicase PcrA
MNNILSGLNKEQTDAVIHINNPSLVIAGAGSGKTKVLTHRVAYLIDQGVDIKNMLVLTFTNKAATDMKLRIENIIETELKNSYIGTFHSVFAKILRIESLRINYPHNFNIYDRQDSERIIKRIIKEQELDDKKYVSKQMLNMISTAKNNMILPSDYPEPETPEQLDIKLIYKLYTKICKKTEGMDFDDLLLNTYILIRDFPDILYRYQNKFKYILIDEYQDTNRIQYLIIKKISYRYENIFVVGDDAQSIYSFRGANIQNIDNFKKDYTNTKTFKLEQNYRSTKMIIDAANNVINNNKKQVFKKIWTENETGDKIKVTKYKSNNQESKMIVDNIIENKIKRKLKNQDFTILYRANYQSKIIEDNLVKRNIPYRVHGGTPFYKRKEVKDIIAYLQLICNNNNEQALIRIINYPKRGIGKNSLEKIYTFASDNKKDLWRTIKDINTINIDLSKNTRKKIYDFVTMIKNFTDSIKTQDAYQLAQELINTTDILKELYEDKTPEGVDKYQNTNELLNSIKEFSNDNDNKIKTLDSFIEEISVFTDADDKNIYNTDKVSLMTVHSAKGLEFPYIYIIGMEEDIFPSIKSLNTDTGLEEERRLFYVAITRAKKEVNISYSLFHYKWGKIYICEPSRFISEIPEEYIELKNY